MALPTTGLAARYIAGTGITTTGQGVSTWADQAGSHDLTQTTDGNRPFTGSYGDGQAFVRFLAGEFLNIPSSLSLDRQACSIFVAMRSQSTNTNTLAIVHFDTNSTDFALYFAAGDAAVFDGGANDSNIGQGTGREVVYTVSDATSLDVGIGPEAGALGASPSGSTGTGGFVGQWNAGSFKLKADVLEIAIYTAAVSASDQNAVLDYFSTTYGCSSRTETQYFVFEGDSLTEGVGEHEGPPLARWTECWPAQFARLFTTQPVCQNLSAGGRLASNMDTNAVARVDAQLTKHAALTDQYAVIWGGTNDINNAATSTAVKASLDSWVSGRNTAGATTVILTITPRTDFSGTKETYRGEVNSHINAGNTGADYVVDVNEIAVLSDPSDTDYYTDGIHMTDLAYGLVAQKVYDTLFPASGSPPWSALKQPAFFTHLRR